MLDECPGADDNVVVNAPSAPALDVVPVRTGSDVQRPFAPIAIAVIVAVALRLAVSWVASDAPAVADMEQYHARAVHLLQHRGFGPDALRGPGYPLLLAGAYATLGESYWSARVFNAVAGGVLVFLTAVLARALGSPWAWVAAMFVAVYPGLVLSSIYLMPDSFFAVWVVGCLASLHRRPLGWAALAGGLAGAAMLTRSLGILLVPTAAAVWVFAWARGDVSWRQVAARAALFVAVCALVIAPWLNFTAGVTGRPLLDSTSGFNALVGSNPRATGRLEMRDNEWLMETYVRGATRPTPTPERSVRP